MLRKSKPVFLFLFLSCLILFIAGYYHWWYNSQHMTQIDYISHPDWAIPISIASDLQSQDYKMIPEADGVTVFWIRRIPNTFTEELYVKKIRYEGDVHISPILLKTHQYLRDFGVEKINDKYHLFFFCGESESNLELIHWTLNKSFQILSENSLAMGFSFASELQTIIHDKSIYLTWSTTKGKHTQIDLASLNLDSGEFLTRPVTDNPVQHNYPNFDLENNLIHLVYLERDPSKSSNLRAVDIGNEYSLIYEQFDLYLNRLQNKTLVAPAAMTMGTTIPQVIADDGTIHLLWNKFFDEIRITTPGRWLYYTAFSPDDINKIKIHRLTPTYSYAFEPTLIKNKNDFILAYINTKEQDLVISKLDTKKPALTEISRLFTNQKIGYLPHLTVTPEGDLIIGWIELEDGKMKLYYSNTKFPHKPGVLEILGMKIEKSGGFIGAYIWFIFLYFFIFPLYSVFLNIDVVLWPVLVFCGLLFFSKRYKKLAFLSKINNQYLIYFIALLLTLIKFLNMNGIAFLFSNFTMPTPLVPYIIGLSLIASLFYMWQLKCNPRHELIVGGTCFLFWIYLINQANFIFQIHNFTF